MTATKQRKGQSAEEYDQQKRQFRAAGPQVNSINWLNESFASGALDPQVKTDQNIMFHACERAYFTRNYTQCLEMIEQMEDTVEALKAADEGKYTKLKKQIVEMALIKKRCIERINSAETSKEEI